MDLRWLLGFWILLMLLLLIGIGIGSVLAPT